MSAERPLQGVRVLVVDDDPDSRDVLRQMVRWFGARVHTARDGREALAWLATQTPDLVLLDLRMPGLDGFAVFERLRADPRLSKLRAVAVTALGRQPDVMRTWEAGFDAHLVKPIDLETLAAALNRAFWARSGQVRFSLWHAPTTASRHGRARPPKSTPLRIVGTSARKGTPAPAGAGHGSDSGMRRAGVERRKRKPVRRRPADRPRRHAGRIRRAS